MSERVVQMIIRAVFILSLLGFGIAFALTSQPVFAGGCVTAALGLIGSLFRDLGKGGSTPPPPLDPESRAEARGKDSTDADR